MQKAKKPKPIPRRSNYGWSQEELDTLRRLYPIHTLAEMRAMMGRSESSLSNMGRQLGLQKTAEYSQRMHARAAANLHADPRTRAQMFRPGAKVWNSGMKGWKAGGRSALHRFKPGQEPASTLPLGSYRVTTHHISGPQLQKKTSTAKGSNDKRWTPVSRLVWEQANGPVPAGHFVVFKHRDLRTVVLAEITPEKLECIDRAENARRNSAYRMQSGMGQLYALKGAITRQVNRINREHAEKQKAIQHDHKAHPTPH